MPELPEVETTRRGIAAHIEGQRISRLIVRQPKLRWPVPDDLASRLVGQTIRSVERRGKYLLLRVDGGAALLHLGMSGSLRVLDADTPPQPHDHVDIGFGSRCLRLRDPRRFGALLWADQPVAAHPLLARLGPEPLSDAFDTDYLYGITRRRGAAVKLLIMDSRLVVGVGNIYASEALYLAGISPIRAGRRISRERIGRLVEAIKRVLAEAIAQGGTTLRDFQNADGRPGYFAQQLRVYGREGLPCPGCGRPLRQRRLGQRASYYCGHCQR